MDSRAVNQHPELLEGPLRAAIPVPAAERIEWCSPLAADGFVECRDVEALRRIQAPELLVSLSDFWPERGPVWDALGRTSAGTLLFVEAKAHVRELVSGATRATPDSREKIEAALSEAREFLAPESRAAWAEVFYQYANRLAFLYFLRQRNGLDAHLVLVNFINAPDVDGPQSGEAWHAAYIILNAALGLPEKHPLSGFVHHLIVDVNALRLREPPQPVFGSKPLP